MKFLKRIQILFFFEKIDVFGKKPDFFFKNAQGSKFAAECMSNEIICEKRLFHLKFELFAEKSKIVWEN